MAATGATLDLDRNALAFNMFFNATVNRKFPHRQIISDELMWTLQLVVHTFLSGLMSSFGFFSNVANITVFYQLGVKDSMSVGLFALSLTDCAFCFTVLASVVFPVWDLFFPTTNVDPMAIGYIGCDLLADALFLFSGWITSFLAVERCVCVIFPFKVNQIFTRNRAVVTMSVTFAVIAATYAPLYASHWLVWDTLQIRDGNNNNRTTTIRKLVFTSSEHRHVIEFYVEILANVLPLTSLFLTVFSAMWMVYGLRMSSVVRESMSMRNSHGKDVNQQKSEHAVKTDRLVKVVLFLAIIFTICSIPRLNAMYATFANPEINAGGKETNLNEFQWQMARFASTINASVNVFVYLKINSSFRMKFNEILKI